VKIGEMKTTQYLRK